MERACRSVHNVNKTLYCITLYWEESLGLSVVHVVFMENSNVKIQIDRKKNYRDEIKRRADSK